MKRLKVFFKLKLEEIWKIVRDLVECFFPPFLVFIGVILTIGGVVWLMNFKIVVGILSCIFLFIIFCLIIWCLGTFFEWIQDNWREAGKIVKEEKDAIV